MTFTVFIAQSLDGFIARTDDQLDWLNYRSGPEREGEDYGYATFVENVDLLLMGSGTYRVMQHMEKWYYGRLPVAVVTRQQLERPTDPEADVTFMQGEPEELLEELNARGIQNVYLDGGKTITRFLQSGLVDRMIITTIPILIGSGIPLFGELERDIELVHESTQSFPGGLVQSTYRVAGRGVDAGMNEGADGGTE